jgi:hypothetical protein
MSNSLVTRERFISIVTIPFIGREFFQTFYTKRGNAENELGTVQGGYKKGIPSCGMPFEVALADDN